MASLVETIEALVDDGLDEIFVRAVLNELGVEFVDDVDESVADYFVSRCIALREESEE